MEFVKDLESSEYLPYYANYIGKVGEKDLITLLTEGKSATVSFFESIPVLKHDYRYSPEKWSIKDILQHLIDAERVFAYRALRFARQDITPLQGFEENDYAVNANTEHRNLKDLIEEYTAQRHNTILMFNSFSRYMLKQIGQASGGNMSARAAGFIIVGHEQHHCQVIKDRYL